MPASCGEWGLSSYLRAVVDGANVLLVAVLFSRCHGPPRVEPDLLDAAFGASSSGHLVLGPSFSRVAPTAVSWV